MTAIDPYRTLEIAPGASQAEIKRAYRRLAKLYHPDSAGERALPRFLAIQVAYETLVDEPGRPRTASRGSAARPTPAPSPAWQADASRARATREAYRARTRRGSAGQAGPSTSKPGGADEAKGPTGSAGRAGSTGGPTGGATRGGTGGTGPTPGSGQGTGARTRRSSRRTKATIGSTSYDGADREPFDPAWEGATWYGAGSGTYWTINPKEYADPRKHGPEYLARSRRGTAGPLDPTARDGPDGPPGTADPAPPAARPAQGSTQADDPDRSDRSEGAPRDKDSKRSEVPKPTRRPEAPARPIAVPLSTPGAVGSAVWPGSSGLQRIGSTLPGRFIVALIGWVPLAVALAAVSQAVPVCGGLSTVCADPLTGGVWIVDLAVIALLAAIPRLGWIAAIASLSFFIVGMVATPVLLAFGGVRTPDGTTSALTVVLVVAWLGGIALALSGRVDLPPWRGRRVR